MKQKNTNIHPQPISEYASLISSYMYYQNISTFLNCPWDANPENADIALIGIPYSGGNAVERGQYLAPRALRNTSMGYRRISRGTRINPFELCKIHDLGDVPLPNILHPEKSAADIQNFYKKVYGAKCIPISIGGDHSITLPILRAFKSINPHEQIAMIHFDSHTDSYLDMGGTFEHAGACFRLAVDESIINPKHSLQLGIRGPVASLSQDDFSYQAGYRVISTEEFFSLGVEATIKEIRKIVGNLRAYISVDLDVLDPAYAPGVADPEIGGWSPIQLIKVIQGCRGLNIMGSDIVCFCPRRDPAEITALAASEVFLELAGITAESLHSRR